MKIHFLAQRRGRVQHTIFPLRVFAKQIEQVGLKVRLFHNLHARDLLECDVLVIVEADFRRFFPGLEGGREAEIRFLQDARARGCRTAWFDDSDSSGCLRTYILPSVDYYIKSQVLVAHNAYAEESRSGSVFQDFYCSLFGGKEPTRCSKGTISVQQAA